MIKIHSIIAGSLICAGSVMAKPINITIPDGQTASGYIGSGVANEDNETEPTTIRSDAWDLEAFGYNQSTKQLDVIGTYNFATGATANGKTYKAGAIFIGTGSAVPSPNNWSYAYVLNFANNTYSLFNNFSIIEPKEIKASSPWTINPSGNAIATGSFNYLTGLGNPDGFDLGVYSSANANSHRMIELGLGDLPDWVLNDFYAHTTMECGNDLLLGHYQNQNVPDSGSAIGLMSVAMTGLVLLRRKLS